MIARLIRLAAAEPTLTLALTLALSAATLATLRDQPLDALPDLSDAQVIVAAEWPGRSPDLVEDQLTYPLVTSLLGSARVRYVRGLSMHGASQITVVFEDGVAPYWARARVAEKLAGSNSLPPGVTPTLGPEATGLGWVYQYALTDKTGGTDLARLRSIQDWQLRFALQSVPGVAEVASVGGFVKRYQVSLDPARLRAFRVTPMQVARALRNGNQEIGANVIELGGTDMTVRGRGYLRSLADIERLPVSSQYQGGVVTIADVGKVEAAPAPRAGAAELDGEGESVGGIVVMRVGGNAPRVIADVKQRLGALRPTLPPGVEIVPVYDRSDLIARATGTLRRALTEEILIVALIVSLFLWHARASWVAILPLPIAVLLSFLPMALSGLTINIMSLGGIALAIGAMVDAGIILVENAHKRLEGRDTRTMSDAERRRIITEAMVEMGRPVFFSLLVITVSFLPIFALSGREGRLFHPLAFTKTVSMAWAALLGITLTPALAVLLLKGRFVREEHHAVSRGLHAFYAPVVAWVVRRRIAVVAAAALLVLATIPVALRIPTEFMPPLQEGSILYMPTAVPGMSLDTAVSVMQRQNAAIKAMPEVERVFGKAGRAGTATDPAPVNMFETVITLKDPSQWRPGMTQASIVAALDRSLDVVGMPNIWWMPIQTRIEMLSTGIRSAVGLKVFGPDSATIERTTTAIESILRALPETASALAERTGSGVYLDVDVRRDAAALQGLSVADVHAAVAMAVEGETATTLFEGRERYAVNVRYAPDFRDGPEALRTVSVPLPGGGETRLDQVATVAVTTGPAMIASEDGRMLGLVFVDVAPGVGLDDYVAKAKSALAGKLDLPQGVELRWSGQLEAYESAKRALYVAVPLTLGLIVLLLYLSTRSAAEVAIVLTAVPFSLIGAFWLMWLLGYKLSVAAWVGLIALAGLDAETGVVMLLYLTRAHARRLGDGAANDWATLAAAIHEGAVQRVRPKIMTVAATLLGLLPVMWATGAGSEVMKRVAAPMVGGVLTSGLLELLVYPAIFALWKERRLEAPGRREPVAMARAA